MLTIERMPKAKTVNNTDNSDLCIIYPQREDGVEEVNPHDEQSGG